MVAKHYRFPGAVLRTDTEGNAYVTVLFHPPNMMPFTVNVALVTEDQLKELILNPEIDDVPRSMEAT